MTWKSSTIGHVSNGLCRVLGINALCQKRSPQGQVVLYLYVKGALEDKKRLRHTNIES
jgi:hypothetical protein